MLLAVFLPLMTGETGAVTKRFTVLCVTWRSPLGDTKLNGVGHG
jgi:hypothetical protein